MIKKIFAVAFAYILYNEFNKNAKFKYNPMQLKYFKISEFDSPDVKGSGGNMRVSTLIMLEKARELAGVAFRINSGYRTQRHNDTLKNSVKDSAHVRGYAVDIHVTPETKKRIIEALKDAGFTRLGIGANFIHADNDPDKPAATWTY